VEVGGSVVACVVVKIEWLSLSDDYSDLGGRF
jgi:hypothetical protein